MPFGLVVKREPFLWVSMSIAFLSLASLYSTNYKVSSPAREGGFLSPLKALAFSLRLVGGEHPDDLHPPVPALLITMLVSGMVTTP